MSNRRVGTNSESVPTRSTKSILRSIGKPKRGVCSFSAISYKTDGVIRLTVDSLRIAQKMRTLGKSAIGVQLLA
jgi:hypothetical protein